MSVADKCIIEEYSHKCSEDCVMPCEWLDTARGQLWICYSCQCRISRGEVSPEWAGDNLAVLPILAELACLNSIEQHLIVLHIPL